MKKLPVIFFCNLLVWTPLKAQDKLQHEHQIRKLVNQYEAHVSKADAKAFVSMHSTKTYTPVELASIQAGINQRASLFDVTYDFTINSIYVGQELAYEEGQYKSRLTPKESGKEIHQAFDYLRVWQLNDQKQWQIAQLIENERPLDSYKSIDSLKGEHAQIAGTYHTENLEVEIKITISDQVVLIVNQGAPLQLFRVDEMEYQVDAVPGAIMRFTKVTSGIASQAILDQVSRKVVAER